MSSGPSGPMFYPTFTFMMTKNTQDSFFSLEKTSDKFISLSQRVQLEMRTFSRRTITTILNKM